MSLGRDCRLGQALVLGVRGGGERGLGDSGEHTAYETDGDGNRTFSEGECDTSRADDPDSVLSPKKEKKKKVLKTPSFLKKKKKDKKEKEKA